MNLIISDGFITNEKGESVGVIFDSENKKHSEAIISASVELLPHVIDFLQEVNSGKMLLKKNVKVFEAVLDKHKINH